MLSKFKMYESKLISFSNLIEKEYRKICINKNWSYGTIYAAENYFKKIMCYFSIKLSCRPRNVYEWVLNYAALRGDRNFVDFALSRHNKDEWNNVLAYASEGKHEELMEHAIMKLNINDQEIDWNKSIGYASKGGHKDTIDFFITKLHSDSKGADFWDFGMACAAEGNHKDIMQYFIARGADDWNLGLCYLYANYQIQKYFQDKIDFEK